ncbi:armadillo repeat-containing protein 7 isoform X3 [Sus scrofa]|uniref:armadillo repeat-containing protein 7 isoform X3 n=1 Tax=Sus scrofa TaxID=9823 RepID=UPI000A2B1D3F|nr:armadillo repeat-containing protein 7 isoform X3 [Sus scrofa]
MAQKPKVDPHVGRLGYLQALVTEFQETESQDAKEQVLANLANFAYDPSNYQYLRQLQVLDLFLDSLSEENETLVEFAIVRKVLTSAAGRELNQEGRGRGFRAADSVSDLDLSAAYESVCFPCLDVPAISEASATCARTGPTRSTFCRQGASHSSSTACPVPTRRLCCLLSPRSCTC